MSYVLALSTHNGFVTNVIPCPNKEYAEEFQKYFCLYTSLLTSIAEENSPAGRMYMQYVCANSDPNARNAYQD